MVKDHPIASNFGTADHSPLTIRRDYQHIHGVVLSIALLISGGCQSGLIDPGRSRGVNRPPQMVVPGQVQVQPTLPPGSVTQGTPPTDWKNVSRQPVGSVVQMSPTAEAKLRYHTVVAGDSWSSLAKQHNLTVKQLADANGMEATAKLNQGQIVYIPEK